MTYKHLSNHERFYIEQSIALGDGVSKIANDLGRHRASLYKEINRNTDKVFNFYLGHQAHNITTQWQSETIRKERFFDVTNK